ncbi:hypothetical protein DFJ77DRAFT_476730 [Powellomyces hirtus]|nr:hypothetical protein DFJ77DRAFT_476730 [Powellomyces hirtus]
MATITTTRSPSHLPAAPSPTVSLPPKLTGNVNYFLHVTISKLVWTNSPEPTKPTAVLNPARGKTTLQDTVTSASLSTEPRVRLLWWGEDGPGTIFQPLSIGRREYPHKRVQQQPSTSSTSSLPVPLIRAKTWSASASASAQATPQQPRHSHHQQQQHHGRTTVAFPVRCYKTQLAAYFRDMGRLVLQVLIDGKVIADVTAPDLAAMVSDGNTARPINGFFPVMEKPTTTKQHYSVKRRKLGELHLSVLLEPAVVNTNSTSNITSNAHRHHIPIAAASASTAGPTLSRHHILADMKRYAVAGQEEVRSADVTMSHSITIHEPRSPPSGPTEQSMFHEADSVDDGRASPKCDMIESTGTSPLLRRAGQLRDAIDELPDPDDDLDLKNLEADDSTKGQEPATTVEDAANDDCEQQEKEIPNEERDVTATDIQSLTKDPAATFAQPQNDEGNHHQATNTCQSKEHTEGQADEQIDQDISNAKEHRTKRDIFNMSSSDDDGSDLLEDDVLIEALNSAKGRNLIDRNSTHTYAYDKQYRSLSSDGLDDGEDDDEDEDPELSDDERKRRAVLDTARRHRKKAAAVAAAVQARPRSPTLSVDKLTTLRRVDLVKVTVKSLDLLPEAVPLSPAAILVQYALPVSSTSSSPSHTAPVTIRSKHLPRLAVSRNTSRRPIGAINPIDPPRYTTSFDHDHVAPCSFDALIEVWVEKQIQFKVTVEYKRATGRVPIQEEWAAEGAIKCADVLAKDGLEWEGKIPMYRINAAEPHPSVKSRVNSGKVLPHGRETRRLVGHLSVNIALQHGLSQESSLHSKEAVSGAALTTTNEHNAHKQVETRSSLALPPSIPYYFHMTISTARALAILPTLETATITNTLLYLVIRLFSASTPPIETPPVVFKSPFDLKTGRLNPPPDFAFAYTVPLAMTAEFIATHSETPLIAEVWVVDSDTTQPSRAPTMKRTEVKSLDLVDRGAKLLGLVRLPFPHLLRTLTAGCTRAAEFDQPLPVMIPDAEYCILDPFSGSAKGWVNAFMALGTWDQIKKVRRSISADAPSAMHERESNVAKKATASDDNGKEAKASRTKHRSKREQVTTGQEADNLLPPRAQAASSTCKMVLTIHQACGLRGLVNHLIMAQEDTRSHRRSRDDMYTPLHYAQQVGANAYVRFSAFPRRLYSVRAGSRHSGYGNNDSPTPTNTSSGSESDNPAATVETHIVAQSFTPHWSHTTPIAVQGVDNDLLRWMRHGGEARGEIWHRVPEDIVDGEAQDVLLGTFRLPLRDIVTKQKGIDRVWIPVLAANANLDQDDDSNDEDDMLLDFNAAIKVSVKLANAFDFGVSAYQHGLSTAGENWWCGLKLKVGRIKVPAKGTRRRRFSDHDVESNEAKDLLYIRWRHPRLAEARDDGGDEWQVVSSAPVPAKRITAHSQHQQQRSSNTLLVADMHYRHAVNIEMTPSTTRGYRDHRMEIQVFRKSLRPLSDDDNNGTGEGAAVLVGAAYIDLSDAFAKARAAHRKRKKSGYQSDRPQMGDDVFVVDGSFPLIDPSSTDLRGATIQLRIDVSPSAPPAVDQVVPKSKPASITQPAIVSRQRENDALPTRTERNDTDNALADFSNHIPVEVTVEKAMKLPLMADPVTAYLPSPFVPHNTTQLAPPNTFVTFKWNEEASKKRQASQSGPEAFCTRVVPAQRAPVWNHSVTIYQERTEDALKALKAGKSIEFTVWHTPAGDSFASTRGRDINTSRERDSGNEEPRELVGVATVDMGGLFGGLKEIYGWYHVLDDRNVSKGQLLIRVLPKLDVAAILRELTRGPEGIAASRNAGSLGVASTGSEYRGRISGSREKCGRRPLQDACCDVGSLSPPQRSMPPPVAIAIPASAAAGLRGETGHHRQGNSVATSSLFAAAASTASHGSVSKSSTLGVPAAQSVDTWVWNGTNWEHRQVDVLKTSTDAILRHNEDDAGSGTTLQNQSTSFPVHVPVGSVDVMASEHSPGRLSFRCTVGPEEQHPDVKEAFRRSRGELDALNAKLKHRGMIDPAVVPTPVMPPHASLANETHISSPSKEVTALKLQPHTAAQAPGPLLVSPSTPPSSQNLQKQMPIDTKCVNGQISALHHSDDESIEAGELRMSHLGAIERTASPASQHAHDPLSENRALPSPAPVVATDAPAALRPAWHSSHNDEVSNRDNPLSVPDVPRSVTSLPTVLLPRAPQEEKAIGHGHDSHEPSTKAPQDSAVITPATVNPTAAHPSQPHQEENAHTSHHITSREADDTWKTLAGRLEAVRADIRMSQYRDMEDEFDREDAETQSFRRHSRDVLRRGQGPENMGYDSEEHPADDDGSSASASTDDVPIRVRLSDDDENEKDHSLESDGQRGDDHDDDGDDDEDLQIYNPGLLTRKAKRTSSAASKNENSWYRRATSQHSANKENLRQVPDLDDYDANETTSDDEIYSVLAYRRMAAAATTTSSTSGARRAARPMTKILDVVGQAHKPYDPFGARLPTAGPRIPWKTAAPESSDTDAGADRLDNRRRRHHDMDKLRPPLHPTAILTTTTTSISSTTAATRAPLPGPEPDADVAGVSSSSIKEWKTLLQHRTVEMSKERQERMERIFRDADRQIVPDLPTE